MHDDDDVDELTPGEREALRRLPREIAPSAALEDRVLRAGHYWVPHWYKASHWIAYWDMFSRPPQKPRYARGVLETWWQDRDKATKLERG